MTILTRPPATPKAPAAKDAIALLKADHATVSDLFADYEKVNLRSKKKALVAEICSDADEQLAWLRPSTNQDAPQ